jgi:hypothetical protein
MVEAGARIVERAVADIGSVEPERARALLATAAALIEKGAAGLRAEAASAATRSAAATDAGGVPSGIDLTRLVGDAARVLAAMGEVSRLSVDTPGLEAGPRPGC